MHSRRLFFFLPRASPFFLRPSPLEVGPLNTARGSGERCKLPSGVWGEAPADKRFGAYLSQKEQLWWQQIFCGFSYECNFLHKNKHDTRGKGKEKRGFPNLRIHSFILGALNIEFIIVLTHFKFT